MSEATPAAHKGAPTDEEAKKRQRELVDRLLLLPTVTSDGKVRLGDGGSLEYTVSAGYTPAHAVGIEGAHADPECAVFTVAYLARDKSPRPVCFTFNGGPGSSSVWLQFGAVGPKRVRIEDDGSMPRPPYTVQDNPLTWLEHFDLVFVDPPHTGYSVAASDDVRKKVLSVDGDIAVLTEVVRNWLSRHKRWSSPVLLAGESYGTTRAAGLADKLQAEGVALAGLVLISCAMDLQTLVFGAGNDLPYALFLPAFACVAQYHGMLKGETGASPAAARAAAEAFAADDYVRALHAGSRLAESERRRIVSRVADLTGLKPSLVAEKNLRITDETFFFELLRDQGRMVGRLEARVTGPMAASRGRAWEFDPGLEALAGPYTMAAQAYFAEIGLPVDRRYEILSIEVHKQWNWNRGEEKGNAFASTSADLARALRRNPHLRVFVASGYYDLGTPYRATDHSLAQLDLPPEVGARVAHHYYDAGHMMYTREGDLRKLKRDLSAWWAEGPVTAG
ncbi:S10 family peptidase [Ramlibacter sp. MMS24-I3-19]|uniref:S10 family peptidase n=1 Tax=Ramlibacter sp. MMS24-I3-19 TaxID=3416606 RepID=UPI003CFDEAAD